MAQQIINIGTTANDGTGDPLRTAFDKCNDNFTELYAGGGGGGGGIGGNTGATDNAILRADGTGGSTLQTSGITIADGASGTLSGTNSGDVTLASPNRYLSLAGQQVTAGLVDLTSHVTGDLPLSSLVQASAEQVLLGRGVGAGAGDFQQITLGTNLSMSGTTLNATGGSGGGNVSGPAGPTTDNALVRWNQTTGQSIQNSSVILSDTQEMSGLESLSFNTSATAAVGIGKLVWDSTNKTLDLGIGSGSVNALLGVDSHVLGRNTSASSITRGQVVLVNGASAGNLTLALALGNSDPNTANTIGLAAENIPHTGPSTSGMVITSGLLRNLNTSTFAAGDLLFISATTAGALTNVRPAAPNHAVRVGYVVNAHSSNGIIYVAVNNGYELDELHDVNYPTTPVTNDFLVYVTNRWQNQAPATARTSMGLGTLATQNGTFSGTSSGTNTGDQTITLTGDVTGTGTGSFAATIANNAVNYAKFQQVDGLSVVGNGGSTTANAGAITGTAGQVLRVNNGGTGLAFGAVDLSTAGAITGTLAIGSGGTGLSSVGANNTVLTSNGTSASWSSINRGSTNVWIPAAQWIPRTTTGCGIDSRELTTNKINTDELLFDPGTAEYAQCMIVMPSNWNAGTITAKFHWTASVTASGSNTDVVWGLRGRAYANDDALDQSMGTAQTVTDTLTAVNDLDISPATSAITLGGTAAAGNPVIFEVYRDAGVTGDNYASDARLLGVEIAYTAA